MNKRFFGLIGLTAVTMLTSCGASEIDVTSYLGDAFTKKNAIVLKYKLSTVIENGYKLKGSITAQENTVLNDNYYLSYTTDVPYHATSYTETVMLNVPKLTLENLKNGDSFKEFSFEISLEIENVFPKDNEASKVYFVLHGSDFDLDDINTYNASDYKYSWDGDKVKIITD